MQPSLKMNTLKPENQFNSLPIKNKLTSKKFSYLKYAKDKLKRRKKNREAYKARLKNINIMTLKKKKR